MKCPICGNELEIKNKQIGTDNSGDPVFNEYAVCRDCKKQWNLDKQRAKKAAAKASAKKPKRQIRPAAKKTRATLLKKKTKTKSKRRTKSRKQLIPAAPKNALLQKLPQKLPTG